MKSKTSTTLTALALVAFTIPLMLTCVGCSSSPSCTDGGIKEAAQELVQEYLTEQLVATGADPAEVADKLSRMKLVDVMDITPKGTPEDQCGCQGTLQGEEGALTLVYTIQTTRDGEQYVEIQSIQ